MDHGCRFVLLDAPLPWPPVPLNLSGSELLFCVSILSFPSRFIGALVA